MLIPEDTIGVAEPDGDGVARLGDVEICCTFEQRVGRDLLDGVARIGGVLGRNVPKSVSGENETRVTIRVDIGRDAINIGA